MRDRLAKFWADNQSAIIKLLLGLFAALVGALGNQQLRDPAVVVQTVEKVVEKDATPKLAPDDPRNFLNGWDHDPERVKELVAEMNPPVFADTPAGQQQELPKAVFGWKFYYQLPNVRGPPPVKNQKQVGSCVGFGNTGAVERTLAAEIVSGNKRFDWCRFSEEVTYGLSRVDVGRNQIRGDGSVGAWAAKALTTIGAVPRQKYDGYDLTEYDEARCRAWAAGSGVPAPIKAVAAQYKVGSATLVKTTRDVMAGLANGYFSAPCSNIGFNNPDGTIGTRDARGVIYPRGTWGHCMLIDGYYTDADGTVYFHITNSWGPTAHRGPVGWGDPNPDGFWTPASAVQLMLNYGDTWMYSGAVGFPRRTLPDFFIRHDPPGGFGERGALALTLGRPRVTLDVVLAY